MPRIDMSAGASRGAPGIDCRRLASTVTSAADATEGSGRDGSGGGDSCWKDTVSGKITQTGAALWQDVGKLK